MISLDHGDVIKLKIGRLVVKCKITERGKKITHCYDCYREITKGQLYAAASDYNFCMFCAEQGALKKWNRHER